MAKSARATTRKRNRAKLRATVFGPADEARTSRLSAKLQELADQAKPPHDEARADMDVDKVDSEDHSPVAKATATSGIMDIDDTEGKANPGQRKTSNRPSRIEKKKLKRKAKSSNVFRSVAAKHRRMSGKKKQK